MKTAALTAELLSYTLKGRGFQSLRAINPKKGCGAFLSRSNYEHCARCKSHPQLLAAMAYCIRHYGDMQSSISQFKFSKLANFGAATRSRIRNQFITNESLCQLSYCGVKKLTISMHLTGTNCNHHQISPSGLSLHNWLRRTSSNYSQYYPIYLHSTCNGCTPPLLLCESLGSALADRYLGLSIAHGQPFFQVCTLWQDSNLHVQWFPMDPPFKDGIWLTITPHKAVVETSSTLGLTPHLALKSIIKDLCLSSIGKPTHSIIPLFILKRWHHLSQMASSFLDGTPGGA